MSCSDEKGFMTMPDGSPVTYDGLPESNFRLLFTKAPFTVFFLQEVVLPEVRVEEVVQNTRFADINNIGEKMIYGDLVIRFLVDKNLKNYSELFRWMRRMTVAGTSVGETDDPVLIINGTEMIRFVGAWPLSLSDLTFKTDVDDVNYITCVAVFNLDYMENIAAPFDVTNADPTSD